MKIQKQIPKLRYDAWKEFESGTEGKEINLKRAFDCGFNMCYKLLRKKKEIKPQVHTQSRGEANRKVYKGVSPYTLMTSSHTLKGGVS